MFRAPQNPVKNNMFRSSLLAASALIALASAAMAAEPLNGQRIVKDVQVLASDAYEGRGPATAGEAKTVDYIVGQLKAAGVQPGAPGGSYTQDVPLGRYEITGAPRFSFASGGQTVPLAQGEQIAVRAAQLNIGHVAVQDAPIVFAGYGVKAPERNWDDFKGMDVKGKVIVVLINDPDFETGQGDFGGKAMTYYGRWTYKYEEGARLGAAGVLIVHETAPASYGWATVKNSNTNVQFDIVRENPRSAHPPVEAWIQRDAAVELLRRAGLDYETLKKQAQSRDFRPVELKGQTFTAHFDVDHKVITSKNVVGRLPGKGHPDETVIYSAHWDHLGVGLPDAKGDRIYNGAVDNADGVATVLEIARTFAKAPRTDRSVAFLFVTAEEKGLLGSTYYAAHPVFPPEKTAGVINIDALAADGPSRDMTTSGSAQLQLQDLFVAQLKAEGRYFTPDPVPEAGHFYRSDHFPLAKVGVPAISVGSGEDLVSGGKAAGKAAGEAYVKDRYHQPADEYDASFNVTGIAQDAGLLYRLGAGLANSRAWPEWGAGSEFKAARDKTAAARRAAR
ncbi:MAG TPA: M28 family metallopeptidase [Caulobacteraceae bacterium]|jgi:Zn-dependent M28 family amino/carboxypeptidase